MKGTSRPKIDSQALLTLKRLGTPPCRFKVEKDERVPEVIIEHWREKGIEVELVGVIKVKFKGSEKVYVYPYRIRDEGTTGAV